MVQAAGHPIEGFDLLVFDKARGGGRDALPDYSLREGNNTGDV